MADPKQQPMLAIKHSNYSDKAAATVIPHLLPCQIHHDGQVRALESHWTTTGQAGTDCAPIKGAATLLPLAILTTDGPADETRVAYFRGRKLHGKTAKLPPDYTGVILEKGPDMTVGAEEDGELMAVACATASFDEVVVWRHEALASATDDAFVRGIEEWVDVARRLHSTSNSRADSSSDNSAREK